jgi:hypothetical protein
MLSLAGSKSGIAAEAGERAKELTESAQPDDLARGFQAGAIGSLHLDLGYSPAGLRRTPAARLRGCDGRRA